MADRRGIYVGAGDTSPTETRESYKLSDLAQMLDAPAEKVRGWLRDADIHPTDSDYPDDYGMDAYEYIRVRGHMF